MKRALALALSLIALSLGCSSDHGMGGSSEMPPGAMAYAGYDAHGRKVVTGWIRLDVGASPSSPVTGAWSLKALADSSTIGPQTGTGQLSGTAVEGNVTVNLDPETVDDNVELQGAIGGAGPNPSSYDGTWQWITLAGTRGSGMFHASRAS